MNATYPYLVQSHSKASGRIIQGERKEKRQEGWEEGSREYQKWFKEEKKNRETSSKENEKPFENYPPKSVRTRSISDSQGVDHSGTV